MNILPEKGSAGRAQLAQMIAASAANSQGTTALSPLSRILSGLAAVKTAEQYEQGQAQQNDAYTSQLRDIIAQQGGQAAGLAGLVRSPDDLSNVNTMLDLLKKGNKRSGGGGSKRAPSIASMLSQSVAAAIAPDSPGGETVTEAEQARIDYLSKYSGGKGSPNAETPTSWNAPIRAVGPDGNEVYLQTNRAGDARTLPDYTPPGRSSGSSLSDILAAQESSAPEPVTPPKVSQSPIQPGTPGAPPPPSAVAYLRQNPQFAEQFRQKYGVDPAAFLR